MQKVNSIISTNNFYSNIDKKYISACILLPFKDKFLIVKKSATQKWGLPGGILRDFESPEAGCIRECFEEINIKTSIDTLFHVYYAIANLANELTSGDSIHFVFLGNELLEDQIKKIEFSDGEIDEIKMVKQKDLENFINENLIKAIDFGFKRITYSNLERSVKSIVEEETNYDFLAQKSNVNQHL